MIRGLLISLSLMVTFNAQLHATPPLLVGQKAQTLLQLEADQTKLQAMTASTAYTVDVPPLYPIDHSTILSWLNAANLNVMEKWDMLNQSLSGQEQKSITDQHIIPSATRQKLLNFKKLIENTASTLADYLCALPPDDPFHLFLKRIVKKNRFLMVRSSGSEDTQGNPNAGGHESKHHIIPTCSNIAHALCGVIASYFDPEKALTQRLQAGDNISQLPALSVFLQEMVPQEKALSIVGFSSGCRVSKCSAWGVTRLSCYPELFQAVENTGNGDHLFVDHYGTIMITAHEPHRTHPLLDQYTIRTIATLVESLESYFDHPVDVEMVYQQSSKTINMVQVRPAVQHTHNASSYLVKGSEALGQKYDISSITAIGNGAIESLDPSNTILASSLENAYQEFQTQPNASKHIKAVIVACPRTNSLSHIAIQLASYGIKIVVVNDASYQDLISHQKTNPLPWIMDVQQQQIIVPGSTINAKKIINNTLPGYAKHPAAGSWSLFSDLLPALPSHQIKTPPSHLNQYSREELLSLISEEQNPHVYDALQQLYYQATLMHPRNTLKQQTVAMIAHHNIILEKHISHYDLVLSFLDHVIDHIIKHKILDKPNTSPDRLFALGQLETLLKQPKDNYIAHTYSVDNILNEYQEDFAFINKHCTDQNKSKLTTNTTWFAIAKEGARTALTSELEYDWIQFINFIAGADASVQKKCTHIFDVLTTRGLFPLWLHTIFAQRKEKNFQIFVSDTAHVLTSSKNMIATLLEKQHVLGRYTQNSWRTPESAMKTLRSMKTNVLDHACSNQFLLNLHENAHPLNKLIAIAYMKQILDVLDDRGIKTLLRSTTTQQNVHTKYATLQQAVGTYLEILESWLPLLEPMVPKTTLIEYSVSLKTILRKTRGSEQKSPIHMLDTSIGFDVKQALITQRKVKPITLHDLFTTIHQNSLLIINHLVQSSLLVHIKRPSLLAKLEQQFINNHCAIGTSTPRLTCLELHDDICLINYSITPDLHSIDIDLRYHKSTDTATVTIAFKGANLVARRWQGLQAFTQATFLSWDKKPTRLQVSEQNFTIEFMCTQQDLTHLPIGTFISLLINLPYAHVANNFAQCEAFIHKQLSNNDKIKTFQTWLKNISFIDNQFLAYLFVINGLGEQMMSNIEAQYQKIPVQSIPFILGVVLKSRHTSLDQKKRAYQLLQKTDVAHPFKQWSLDLLLAHAKALQRLPLTPRPTAHSK